MLYDLVSFMNTATHDDDYTRIKEEASPMRDNELKQNIPADDGSVRWFLLYDFLPSRSAEKLIHTPAIWESDDPASCFQSDQIRICTYMSWGFDRGLYDLDTLIKGYDILIKINAGDVFYANRYGSEFDGENLLKVFMQARPLHDKRSGYGGEPFEMKNLMESWRIFTVFYMDEYDDREEYQHAYLSKKLPVTKLPVNADDIAADSRRKIKKEDIILAELTKSGEAADSANYLVFTETALYQFVGHRIQNIIKYAEIEDADFTDDSVSVTTKDKNCINIEVGTSSDIKESSPRILFNLLMDIKERVEKIDTAERNREDFYKEAEKRGALSERIAELRARSAQSFDNARRISNNITEYKAKRASRMEEDY